MRQRFLFASVILTLITACNSNTSRFPGQEAYRAEIDNWHKSRLENLKAPDGWLSLAGLYWLHEGPNSFGSDTANDIIFPQKAPGFIGIIDQTGDSTFLRSVFQPMTINGIPARQQRLHDDASQHPDLMTLNSLAWLIIKRGNRFGIRLRDYDSPMRDSLTAIPYFETKERWRVIATFEPYEKPETLKVQTVIGTEEENTVPGRLTFRIRGRKHVLYPFDAGNDFFIVFGDQTNGNETYPAGRFLYTSLPDAQNNVIIDFNRAYNPPCAFTPFATCPLPIRKNILPVRIEAGEMAVHLPMASHGGVHP